MDNSCKTPRWRLLKAQLNNLSPKDFAAQIKATAQAVIIDVRTEQEYAVGHITNAINIDYLDEAFWDKIEALTSTDTSTFFVYCRSGRRSIRACTLMRNGGFDNARIFNLDGGYSLWVEYFG